MTNFAGLSKVLRFKSIEIPSLVKAKLQLTLLSQNFCPEANTLRFTLTTDAGRGDEGWTAHRKLVYLIIFPFYLQKSKVSFQTLLLITFKNVFEFFGEKNRAIKS